MDNNDRRQRPHLPTAYGAQPGILHSSSTYPSISAADRYRPQSITSQAPATASSASRGGAYGYGYGGDGASYVGQSMQAGGLQYPTTYSPDHARSSQSYPQYAAGGMMYGVAQQQHSSQVQQQQQQQQQPQPSAQAAAYDAVQQYPQRQNAAIEVLSSQFGGVGHVAQDYYVEGDGGPTSAPAVTMAEPSINAPYPGLTYPTHQSSDGAFLQQPTTRTATTSDVETAYGRYDTLLKRTFKATEDRRIAEAGHLLLELSNWLLTNAEVFVRDDQDMHASRLKMWEDFNNCWLAALEVQKEMTEEALSSGQRPQAPQSLMTKDYINTMAREIIRLCDMMEKHGLVDYQMGVLEEEIIAMLIKCDDLLQDSIADATADADDSQNLTSASKRR